MKELPTENPTLAYLRALYADAPERTLVELRYRSPSGRIRTRFLPARERERLAATIAALSAHFEVFIGVLTRARRGSTRAHLHPHARVLWADCDTPASLAALASFAPPPALLIASSRNGRHAYWLLSTPAPLAAIERSNRQLARALHADARCVDAARILRPAGAINRKRHPAEAVLLLSAQEGAPVTLEQIDRATAHASTPPRAPHSTRQPAASRQRDPLLQLDPAHYIQALAGIQPDRAGKARCPFHDDEVPSLHVYPDPARGWYCFGCGRGGSIYDFASHLWGTPARGSGFLELRARLSGLLAAGRTEHEGFLAPGADRPAPECRTLRVRVVGDRSAPGGPHQNGEGRS